MRIAIKPSAAPDREIDVTHALVRAVAEELWRNCGGNDVLNWMEAEQFVRSLVEPRPAQNPEPRQHRPVRPREDAPRPSRRLLEEDRITGPLPVF